MRVEYYSYNKFSGGYPYERDFLTLREAKRSYLMDRNAGAELSNCIYGKTSQDESIYITYVPFYSDTRSFGRAKLTMVGAGLKRDTIRGDKAQETI